ncbi:hypothetical protein ABI59_23940 [Acidobacteria bacterium Mor1]|nr:hypothetical protein ABI59_23940 [Acidobacteria bacterium Mor1]
MSNPVLVAEGLCKAYDGVDRITVLDGLDLTVEAGDSVAVAGVSGVGKSTLLHLLGGLDRPDAGLVIFQGESLGGFDAARLAEYRNRHVGFVFQFHHLLPEFTALENVMVPLRIGGNEAEGADRARFLLDRLGLGARLQHRPSQLSGGEQQRVAVARALAVEPTLVLADEPTGNLDPGTGLAVFETLRELQEEQPFALVLATHSESLARTCGRVMRMRAGKLETMGENAARDYFDGVAG